MIKPDAKPAPSSGFDLSDLLLFLWQKKIRIVFFAAFISVFGAYYVVNQPRVYSAESTIMISKANNSISFQDMMSSYQRKNEQKLETHIQVMKSRQFAMRLVNRLELDEHPEYLSSKGEPREILYVAQKVLDKMSISKISDTDMMKIKFEARSPQLATKVANTVGPVFFEYLNEMSQKRAIESTRWLSEQLKTLQEQLSDSEEALLTFMRENDLIEIQSQIDLAKTEISKILEQKLFVDKSLSAAESITKEIETRKGDIQSLLQIPGVAINDTVRDHRNRVLAQVQVLEEISKRYKYKHYKYKAAESSLELLRKELRQVVLQITDGKKQEYESLFLQQKQLQDQLDQTRERLNNLGKYELQLSRMEREVEATRRVYELFLSKMQETQIFQDLGDNEEYAVVDEAVEPKYPTKPKITLGITLVLMFSTVFSAGFWLVIHLIRDRRNRFRQLLTGLELPLLAEIPRVEWTTDGRQQPKPKTNVFGYDESIRTLRTALVVNETDAPVRKIGIVSIGDNEGSEEIAIALADSFSNLEKTLLIDCDLRTRATAQRFKINEKHPGIVNFINREVKFNACLHRVKSSQLFFMPSGHNLGDPLEHIGKPRFASLLHKLSVFYERVIITSPAIMRYSDSMVLSQHFDSIIIVTDIEKCESAEFTEGIRRLQDSGVTILGVAFNRVRGLKTARPDGFFSTRLFKKAMKKSAKPLAKAKPKVSSQPKSKPKATVVSKR